MIAMRPLADHHRQALEGDSGLTIGVIDARGYWTATKKAELEQIGFPATQRNVPCLVIPIRDVFEKKAVGYQIKPDSPRTDAKGRVVKYEIPRSWAPRLDINPIVQDLVADAKSPLFITEGSKKADAAAVKGLCCISILGVTMWKAGVALPDWHGVRLKDRKVYICFDSDAAENPQVAKQMRELGRFLAAKGASVRFVSLPSDDGRKVGLDDFFKAGGTKEQLFSYASEEPPRAPRAQLDGDSKKYPWTDSGNAERLVDRFGQDMRYCALLGKWLVWTGTHWEIDLDGAAAVFRMAKDVVREMRKEFEAITDEDLQELATKFALQSENRRKLQDMVELVKTHSSITVRTDDIDTHPCLLNLANGTLDLRTFEMREHRREDLLTRIIDIPYDIEADCPRWIDFLDVILQKNSEVLRYIWKACGYSLTGEIFEKCFFFLHGANGDNGKSTFIETLMSILGPYARATPIDTILAKKESSNIPNDIARLKGVRLVSAPEAGENKRLNEELIKQLTGKDTVTARFLHSEFFDFKPEFKLWMTGNYVPKISGQDPAIWGRVKLIPFTYSVPKEQQDQDLPAKLYEERAGILSWMIDGCMAWRKERLKQPDVITDAVEKHRKEMDDLGAFINDCIAIDTYAETKAADLYQRYEKWCTANGMRAQTSTSFGRRMPERGFEKIERNKGTYYVGIQIIDHDDTSHVYRGGD